MIGLTTYVDCQHCQAKRIGTNPGSQTQYRCIKCKWWTTVSQDTRGGLHYWRVDRRLLPVEDLAQSA